MDHETRLLDLPSGRLEVWLQGSGHPVVLLPSLGRGQEDFDGIAPMLLAAGLRLIRPEPRGIGQSAPLREGSTLFDMARDVIAAMEQDGVATALVAGHAAGNWVARITAHLRPDLVQGVAMLAAVTGTTVDPEISAAIAGSFDTSLPDEVRLGHLRRGYFAPGNDASVWLPGWHTEVARAQRRAREATTDRSWLRVADRKPLLYLAAAEDAIAAPPSEADLRATLGPLAQRVVIERAGHALLPEQPQAVAEALIDYARRLWP
ncbi:alpha/beta fold hydrolase [Neoroseomonas oryzicola]|uniref:Alpha/beta hydrolase n=1 Tax=Neoroseomonas oryzicola TaxID=535904 RepID=A0A9X9WKG8_9PROT|nr:alpha/beta hydrolase [Neoroseomonas oryzicola]MBR0660828.1 alpha/beta hydrolase [Neoroseomonas oryzicola]NKE19603.1 alpha/beta hydrolase [Neoroseomonas oryzicola]